jgi:hypothetical protein
MLFTGSSYFCTLPVIIIYLKIIAVQQFQVQQLRYWKSIPSVRTFVRNTGSKVLSENFIFPALCRAVLQYLVQQQQIGGNTQSCMHEGYIIISEKLKS